jgi:hypothetical protein
MRGRDGFLLQQCLRKIGSYDAKTQGPRSKGFRAVIGDALKFILGPS